MSRWIRSVINDTCSIRSNYVVDGTLDTWPDPRQLFSSIPEKKAITLGGDILAYDTNDERIHPAALHKYFKPGVFVEIEFQLNM